LHGLGPIDTGPGHGRRIVIGTGPRPRARVRPVDEREAPMPTGGCDRGDIAKQVRARAASFRTCYELQLVSRPDLSGKMTVRWTIAEDGRVRSVSTTQDSVGNDAVSSCVLRAFERMSFQKPEAGVCVVQWPLVFTN
jgi:TonB family protein